ncbi:MAG: glucokinase [Nitrososphaerales archaeon]
MEAKYIVKLVLAGDIGATKTILSTFSLEADDRRPLVARAEQEFPSRDHATFKEIVQDFLSKNSIPKESLKQVVFGIAGPVIDGHSKLTNLQWELDEEDLSRGLGLRDVRLLNDLEATANYVPFLKQDEKQILHDGDSYFRGSSGTAAIIAPGTGLGEAFLTRDEGRYHAHASEGGHCDFAPASETEDGLLQYLREKFKHVSYELVCSGKGIYNIWSYFHEVEGSAAKFCSASANIPNADDPTPIIVHEAMRKENYCNSCVKSLDTLVSVLGGEAGNLALKFLATKGVFIAGGFTLQILPALTNGRFMQSYLRKGRMSNLVSRMPVVIILTHRAALIGAAHCALDLLRRGSVQYGRKMNRLQETGELGGEDSAAPVSARGGVR